MATTTLSILNNVAYRLGESGHPDNAAEQTRRLSFFNEAYNHILRDRWWWFMVKEYSFQTVDGQDIYSLPSDFRAIIDDVRVDGEKVYVLPTESAFMEYLSSIRTSLGAGLNKHYYIWNDELYLIPEASSTPTSYDIDSISVSGTTATLTTSSAHGLSIDEFVTIADCTGTDSSTFNTSHKIKSVPSTTTYTITVASGTGTPTVTSATSTQNNVTLKYYYYHTEVTDTSTNILIPDLFKEVLTSYVYARISHLNGKRGDASDGLEEHNEILNQMVIENNKRNSYGLAVSGEDFLK